MWKAVPITNQNPGYFYHDLNEIKAKIDMPKLNTTGHLPPESNPTRLTVASLIHTPNSNLDSPNVMHTSTSFINLSTTDPGTAETCPLNEFDDVPLEANEAFPSINPATSASEAFGAPLPVQHDETPAGASAPMNPATTPPEAFEAQQSVQHDEIPVGDTSPCQDTSMCIISFPETSKSPR